MLKLKWRRQRHQGTNRTVQICIAFGDHNYRPPFLQPLRVSTPAPLPRSSDVPLLPHLSAFMDTGTPITTTATCHVDPRHRFGFLSITVLYLPTVRSHSPDRSTKATAMRRYSTLLRGPALVRRRRTLALSGVLFIRERTTIKITKRSSRRRTTRVVH